jgi:hypothetical protein
LHAAEHGLGQSQAAIGLPRPACGFGGVELRVDEFNFATQGVDEACQQACVGIALQSLLAPKAINNAIEPAAP